MQGGILKYPVPTLQFKWIPIAYLTMTFSKNTKAIRCLYLYSKIFILKPLSSSHPLHYLVGTFVMKIIIFLWLKRHPIISYCLNFKKNKITSVPYNSKPINTFSNIIFFILLHIRIDIEISPKYWKYCRNNHYIDNNFHHRHYHQHFAE